MSHLRHLSFNQDYSYIAISSDNNFIIYNIDPLVKRLMREFNDVEINIVEMLFRCNILAIVGKGNNSQYQPNKVMIWDDYQNKCIAELTFKTNVKGVKLRKDKIIVVLENKIFIYNFINLAEIFQVDTIDNPKGLCAVSNSFIAYPGKNHGDIELYNGDTKIINAHKSNISQIALSLDGSKMATASNKGTLIRIFNTSTHQLLHEFRRGVDRAEIYSLSFDNDGNWLVLSSDKGTIHVYGIGNINKSSNLSFIKPILPGYFNSVWSFAQMRVPDIRTICSFGTSPNIIIAISEDGWYYKFSYDLEKGGEAKIEVALKFIDV